MGVTQQIATREINATTFDADVLQSDKYVLVDFWAPWCVPCLMMAPILDEVATELKEQLEIIKINVDLPDNRELSYKYSIQSIPNMKLFHQGKVVGEFIGLRPKNVLVQEIKDLIS